MLLNNQSLRGKSSLREEEVNERSTTAMSSCLNKRDMGKDHGEFAECEFRQMVVEHAIGRFGDVVREEPI